MSMRTLHGTDCFEVEAFIARNEESKIFKVRHKTNGHYYVMEVASRKNGSQGTIDTNLQETYYHLSKFWVNLKFTFQTSTKLYYILDYIGESSLESLCIQHGPLSEIVVQYYASEILSALEELHSHGYMYGGLGLDKVFIDNTGHIVLWRSFCGKTYWTREECVCSMYGFTRGNLCENTHGKSSERELKVDFQLLGLAILQLFSKEYFTSMLNNKTSPQEGLSRVASTSFSLPSSLSVFARDLITRLLKGQFYNSSHVKTHPFFIGVNWKMVNARLTTPPSITRKVSFPPPLRKTSSEACLHVERTPPPYVRPSTPVMASPINYTNDHMTSYQYAQSPPSHPRPPRMLRSTLSFPDLSMFGRQPEPSPSSMFGRQPEPSPWSRDHPIQPTFHDNHFKDSGRYSAQSMSDLTSINNTPYGRQRTSSFTEPHTRGDYVPYDDSERERRISHNMSFPPGNQSFFDRQHDHNGYYSSYGSGLQDGTFDRRYTPQQPYNTPSIYGNSYSNTADHYYSSSNPQFNAGPGMIHVINDGRRRSRENVTSLHRARSCSQLDVMVLDDEQTNPRATPTIENSERRKYYPLAQVPIPSFAEFKRKTSMVGKESDDKETEVSSIQHQQIQSEKTDKELTSKPREKVSLTDSVNKNESKTINKSNSETTTDKNTDYYSHNDVIHSLMMKYGLYERSEKRKESRNIDAATKKDKEYNTTSKINSFLESRKKQDAPEKTQPVEKDEELSLRTRKEVIAPRGSPRGQRRRASAAIEQQIIEAPRLTRKSKSTLSPNSLSLDINNNIDTDDNRNKYTTRTVEDVIEKVRKNTKKTSHKITESNEDKSAKLPQDAKEIFAQHTTRISPDISEIMKKRKSSSIRDELSSASSPTLGSRYRELSSSKVDLLSIADVYRTPKQTSSSSSSPVPSEDSLDTNDKNQKPPKTLWAAAKFKLKLVKSPLNSPLVRRKDKESTSKDSSSDVSPKEGKGKKYPRIARDLQVVDDIDRRQSLEPPSPGPLQKGGLHTSLLSISSSIYSTDNELDDTSSIQSVDEPGGRRRWESFHSNISADSGSAHMYDFENDAMDDIFDENEPEPELTRKKSDSEIERADSGIGGDIGRHHKQSWEDIVLKSSRKWSVVAASARHWQEIAKKNKMDSYVATRRKSITPVITEDMVECLECQKYYVPEPESSERTSSKSAATVCPKCRERRVERKEAIIELVQTEINYANDLQILKEEFYSPLQSGGILQPDQLAEIFLNLQELVEVSTKFSSRLQKALEESVSKGNEEFSQVNVGSIFLESVDFFQSYEIYCTKQNAASVLLESLQKKNELLKIFLNVTCRENPKCRKMDLNSFLLAPIQRIMKYPLLLSRIRKATPRRNTDREKLMQAQRKIEEQLNRINALNSTVESRPKRYRGSGHLGRSDSLDKLQMKKMASEILSWSMGEMHLLMHGVFEVVIHEFISSSGWSRRGSKRTVDVFMLFCVLGMSEPQTIDSDEDNNTEEPLFPSDPDGTDAALVMLKKKMNGKYTLFKEPLSLKTCIVCKEAEHKDCFEVINMAHETYVFKAASIKESKKWLKHLRLQAKDMGTWKKRRNGLPNIMIKTI